VATAVAVALVPGAAPEDRAIPKLGRAWTILALALGLAAGLVLWAAVGSSAAPGRSGGAAGDVVISTTVMPDGEVVVTILNVPLERMALYAADAKRSRLRLLAVRDISADMGLTDYNNDPPLPRDIKDIRARLDKGAEAPRPAPAPEAP
jgi:hypothetical protein